MLKAQEMYWGVCKSHRMGEPCISGIYVAREYRQGQFVDTDNYRGVCPVSIHKNAVSARRAAARLNESDWPSSR